MFSEQDDSRARKKITNKRFERLVNENRHYNVKASLQALKTSLFFFYRGASINTSSAFLNLGLDHSSLVTADKESVCFRCNVKYISVLQCDDELCNDCL